MFVYRDVAERVKDRIAGLGYRLKSKPVSIRADGDKVLTWDGRAFPRLYHLQRDFLKRG